MLMLRTTECRWHRGALEDENGDCLVCKTIEITKRKLKERKAMLPAPSMYVRDWKRDWADTPKSIKSQEDPLDGAVAIVLGVALGALMLSAALFLLVIF